MNYCQCELMKENTRQVSWIPEKFAKLGKILKLKENGEWIDGWKVISVGTARDEDKLPDYRQLIKSHLKATGDKQ